MEYTLGRHADDACPGGGSGVSDRQGKCEQEKELAKKSPQAIDSQKEVTAEHTTLCKEGLWLLPQTLLADSIACR
jgi:hypothetical protein